MPNWGLVVLNPSSITYNIIIQTLADRKASTNDFADQALLGDVFSGRWVPLPYVYNGLKTLRWPNVHNAIWRNDRVKNIHYDLTLKPWEINQPLNDELVKRWQTINDERLQDERQNGIISDD